MKTELLMTFLRLIIALPSVLLALSFHEYAHAKVADKLGDHTARYLGRLTINPAKHFDPFGAICLWICGFGWAKPVPVRMMNFKRPKRDMAFTAIAGPVTNLLLAFIGTFIFVVVTRIVPLQFSEKNFADWMCYILYYTIFFFCTLNISLAIFNLIPLPPFDGSRILTAFLPDKYYMPILRHEREISLGFFAVLILDSLTFNYIGFGLSFIVNGVFTGFQFIFNSLINLFV
jgi:Zn-dependent protease